MSNITEVLQRLGFSDYEARAYVALLRKNPLNGYELAKISKLPRANIYAVLEKLEERGAALRMDTPEGVQYVPVPPLELTRRLEDSFQDTISQARLTLTQVPPISKSEYVWNIQSYPGMLKHAQDLVESAQSNVLLAVWPAESEKLNSSLAKASQRGVNVTTLCTYACDHECGFCQGKIYRYKVTAEEYDHWFGLVVDGVETLAGAIGADDETLAVRSRQRLVVNMVSWYIHHSLALALLIDDLGPKLASLVKPETLIQLSEIGPAGYKGGWLAYMRQLHR